jgi:hypothetical protein
MTFKLWQLDSFDTAHSINSVMEEHDSMPEKHGKLEQKKKQPFSPISSLRMIPRPTRVLILILAGLLAILASILLPRIPLGPHYHEFADNRAFFGLPNTCDVLSNLPFFLAGTWGLLWLLAARSRRAFIDQQERIPYLIFFAGVAATGVGSFWYHLSPSNARLPWDLLPMTCSYMSLIAATLMERVHLRSGLLSLAPLLTLGVLAVVFWQVTAAHGHGNYQFYLCLQYLSPVILILIVALFPPRYSGLRYLVMAFGLFVAAKLFETFDYSIFHFTGFVSGHSLKHATAGFACVFMVHMLQVRRPIIDDRISSQQAAVDDRTLTAVQQ